MTSRNYKDRCNSSPATRTYVSSALPKELHVSHLPSSRGLPSRLDTTVVRDVFDQVGHAQRPYFWNSQSRLSSGQTDRALSHREMQWKWNACWIEGVD
jgi:hypothetical protein